MLTLAADQRFGAFDPQLDAVWQLSLNPNGPLNLETSFGLRVESFRVFPVFIINNKAVTEINAFLSPPRVDVIFSNYASISCSPAEGLQARCEYWVPESSSLLARFTLTNTGQAPINLGLQSAADLCPQEGTLGMNAAARNYFPYLQGTSAAHIALAQQTIPGGKQPYSPQRTEMLERTDFTTYTRCSAVLTASMEARFSADPEIGRQIAAYHTPSADLLGNPPYANGTRFFFQRKKAYQRWRALVTTRALTYLINRSRRKVRAAPASRISPRCCSRRFTLCALPLSQYLPVQAAVRGSFCPGLGTLPDATAACNAAKFAFP